MSRQILIATFNTTVEFVIPKGMDLDDKTKIKEYWVRYGTLHIEFVDGTTQKIEYENEPDTDWETPNDTNINYEEEWDDGEEEEEDKED
jgi:hypothetical protein